jgi:hypothetical protein
MDPKEVADALALVGRSIFDPRHMCADIFGREFEIATLGAGGVVAQAEIKLLAKRYLRPNRARREAPATSWADVVKDCLYAVRAIGAFIRANASIGCGRR